MATEIERKFLIDKEKLSLPSQSQVIKQGYISVDPNATVRVRIKNNQAFLTLKGKTLGATRLEFEYPIPVDDANQILLNLCRQPFIEKSRYEIPYGNHIWEVDIFASDNAGLCLAEIELNSEDEEFEKPPWVTDEVTLDTRYYNANLLDHPFKNW